MAVGHTIGEHVPSRTQCSTDGVRRPVRVAFALAAASAAALVLPGPAVAAPSARPALYLVTLTGPGSAGHAGRAAPFRLTERLRQDVLLDRVGAPRPVYRWMTALDGFAVRLTPDQADRLRSNRQVASLEQNAVRPLTDLGRRAERRPTPTRRHGGGRGVVIGVVDSGLAPASPVFATGRDMRGKPGGFDGACASGAGWYGQPCRGKVVGARWFVHGFGSDRLASTERRSPLDVDGHGTLSASIAAGDAGVSVHGPGVRRTVYAGAAPHARLAVYKACWLAPDPSRDGCASADLVTAVDRATRDGVDVLNLAVGGPDRIDTVERALLGAAEAGVVVVASAGNGHPTSLAAHPSPWVTTVGATTAPWRVGTASLTGGPRLTGAMASGRSVGPARLVLGAQIAARGHSGADAARCEPGSLDTGRAAGRVVVCRRGEIGRVDKSAAVLQAGGVGMVLLNTAPGAVDADFHSVPTVHLAVPAARTLVAWLRRHPLARVSLTPSGRSHPLLQVTGWSRTGDPRGPILKPDVVAPGTGVLGAVPPGAHGLRWDVATGTSAATAAVSGLAASLLSTPGWTPAQVRSALGTTAVDLPGSGALAQGAGLAAEPSARPHLAYLPPLASYRRWLVGRIDADALDVPSILTTPSPTGDRVVVRRVTNVSARALYFSSSVTGFTGHQVTVTPAALQVPAGGTAVFRVHVYGAAVRPLDAGRVIWTAADGTSTSIPVVVAR